ncbi:D-isomer specific 2-hydroxyacid dehydrogenase, NAD binding domain-containing protein [Cladophialophora immunda]|nr:D-isomer specific 2-hydroxyacid dehydrogenase, NAD binding domain-containing protein [Cladophialophora immunda]
MRAVDPKGQVLGIVGMGAIGRAIAQKAASALGMEIHYHNRRRLGEHDEVVAAGPGARATYHDTLDSLLSVADCLCLACGCSPEMVHMISAPQFDRAKETGLRIVNVGRGALIDEGALIAALEAGKVIGLGLDVHEDEPNINPRLLENYMVTVLPHVGTCSRTSWANIEKSQLDDLEDFFFGSGMPPTAVNGKLIKKT